VKKQVKKELYHVLYAPLTWYMEPIRTYHVTDFL